MSENQKNGKENRRLSGGKRALFILAAVLLSVLLSFVLAEVAFRGYIAYRLRGSLEDLAPAPIRDPNAVLNYRDLLLPSSNPNLAYRLKPLTEGIFLGGHVQIDSRGLRNPEFDDVKTSSTIRILTLGDSNTFGWGVNGDEAYPRVLEDALRRVAPPDKKIEVINMGIAGANAVQEVELFSLEGVPLKPDLVTIQFDPNDILVPAFLMKINLWTPRRLFLPRAVAGQVLSQDDFNAFQMFESPVADSPLDVKIEDIPPQYRHMFGWEPVAAAYRRLKKICDDNGLPIMALLPAHDLYEERSNLMKDPAYDPIRKVLAELKIPVVDTFQPTRQFAQSYGLSSRDLSRLWPSDKHPTAVRQALMARTLFPPVARALKLADETRINAELKNIDRLIYQRVAEWSLTPPTAWGGETLRYTKRSSRLILEPKGPVVTVQYAVLHPDVSASNPLTVTFSLEGMSPIIKKHEVAGKYEQKFELPESAAKRPTLLLQMTVDRTFKPFSGGPDVGIGLFAWDSEVSPAKRNSASSASD